MDRYQITDCGAGFAYAGSKAPTDAAGIAEEMGYTVLTLRMRSTRPGSLGKCIRQAGYIADWEKAYERIPQRSLVLLQHPFHYPQLTREKMLARLKAKKDTDIISMVHDVEKLRGYRYNEYYRREMAFMLEMADVLIVPGEAVREFFEHEGFPGERMVTLGLFDYLQKAPSMAPPKYSSNVLLAGRMDSEKGGFVFELGSIPQVSFRLYGTDPGERTEHMRNVCYKGMFPPDSPGDFLKEGFGLVWDGNELATCGQPSGEYLKYNVPHKLSLFLSCAIPVIIWKEAACARLVQEAGAGLCVSSLYELEDRLGRITEAEYRRMSMAAERIGTRLREGYYTRTALRKAESIIQQGR